MLQSPSICGMGLSRIAEDGGGGLEAASHISPAHSRNVSHGYVHIRVDGYRVASILGSPAGWGSHAPLGRHKTAWEPVSPAARGTNRRGHGPGWKPREELTARGKSAGGNTVGW